LSAPLSRGTSQHLISDGCKKAKRITGIKYGPGGRSGNQQRPDTQPQKPASRVPTKTDFSMCRLKAHSSELF